MAGQPKLQARMRPESAGVLRRLAAEAGGFDALAEALHAADQRTRRTRGTTFAGWLASEGPDLAGGLRAREAALQRREAVVRRWLQDAPLADAMLRLVRRSGLKPASLVAAVQACGSVVKVRDRELARVLDLRRQRSALETEVRGLRQERAGGHRQGVPGNVGAVST